MPLRRDRLRLRRRHDRALHLRRDLRVPARLPLRWRMRVRDQEVAASGPRDPAVARPALDVESPSVEDDVKDENETKSPPSAPVIETFVANHRELLRYVERRVGSRATAEEILQDVFVRSLDREGEIRESTLGWLYRLLRNAVIDHQRRRAVEERRIEQLANEPSLEPDEELTRVACQCVTELASTLKPEYAEALRRVEIDGVAVKDYAQDAGISANNAGVRVFRARKALREQVARACGTCAEHGCFDCTCRSPASP